MHYTYDDYSFENKEKDVKYIIYIFWEEKIITLYIWSGNIPERR